MCGTEFSVILQWLKIKCLSIVLFWGNNFCQFDCHWCFIWNFRWILAVLSVEYYGQILGLPLPLKHFECNCSQLYSIVTVAITQKTTIWIYKREDFVFIKKCIIKHLTMIWCVIKIEKKTRKRNVDLKLINPWKSNGCPCLP